MKERVQAVQPWAWHVPCFSTSSTLSWSCKSIRSLGNGAGLWEASRKHPHLFKGKAREALFCSIWVWASIPRIDHPQKITPSEAVTCSLSQPLIADQNQLLGYQRQEALDILWSWLSPCSESVHSHVMPSCLPPPQYSQTDQTWSSKFQIVCYLLKPTTLMAITCTQLMNKDTIIMHPSYPLHPIRGFSFFWSYLGPCGLLCHTGWVMKGYRKQPETWY